MDREKVIKAFECCKCSYDRKCEECPYEKDCRHDGMPDFGIKNALNLMVAEDNEIDTLKTLLLGYETGAIKQGQEHSSYALSPLNKDYRLADSIQNF